MINAYSLDVDKESIKWIIIETSYGRDVMLATQWCREFPSDGLFYLKFYLKLNVKIRWYFEKDEDALMFTLKWLKE